MAARKGPSNYVALLLLIDGPDGFDFLSIRHYRRRIVSSGTAVENSGIGECWRRRRIVRTAADDLNGDPFEVR